MEYSTVLGERALPCFLEFDGGLGAMILAKSATNAKFFVHGSYSGGRADRFPRADLLASAAIRAGLRVETRKVLAVHHRAGYASFVAEFLR